MTFCILIFLHQEEYSCWCLMWSTGKTGCLLSIGQENKYVHLFTCSILWTPKQTMRGPLSTGAWLLIWAETVSTRLCFALIIWMRIIWTWIPFPEGVNSATSLTLSLSLCTLKHGTRSELWNYKLFLAHTHYFLFHSIWNVLLLSNCQKRQQNKAWQELNGLLQYEDHLQKSRNTKSVRDLISVSLNNSLFHKTGPRNE